MPPRASSRKTAATVDSKRAMESANKLATKSASTGSKRGRKPLNASITTVDVPAHKNNGTTVSRPVAQSKRAHSQGPAPGRAAKRVTVPPKKPRPLFSAQATRAAFNPLPHPDPLDRRRNERCGNELNSFTFDPHPWLKLPLTKGLSKSMLIFGSGDMGQMGLGPEKLDDIKRPVVHTLVAELTRENKMGDTGLETVACGGMHSLLVDGAGKIWSWGINDNAALGRTTEGIEGVDQEELESRPMIVEGLVQCSDSISGEVPFRAVRVGAGDSVSVAVSDQGETRAWGSFRSNDGLLGFDGNIGTEAKQLVPTRVSNLSSSPVAQIVCGYDHVLALATDGHVYSWGNGQQHQLGRKIIERRKRNGLTPERLHLKHIVLIGSGGSHSFAVNQAGLVYGWGLNTRGQLGIGNTENASEYELIPVPTLIESLSPEKHGGARVVAIAGGDFHSLFLFNNGEVWAVGSYENHEIGLSKSHEVIVENERRRADGLAEKQKFVAEGLARRKETVETEIGAFVSDGSTNEKPRWDEMAELIEMEQIAANLAFVPGQCIHAPLKLDFPSRVIDISCGTRHNLAVDEHGNAYSWGLGQSNELGQGKDEDGHDIELVETPRRLSSKALAEGPSQLKIIKCEAGGTHSILIGVGAVEQPVKVNGTIEKVNGS